jgi:hypothetical protein
MTEEQKVAACIFIAILILGFMWVMYQVEIIDPNPKKPKKNSNLSERQAYFRIARVLGYSTFVAESMLSDSKADEALWRLIRDSEYDCEVIADELVIEVGWEKHIFSKSFKKTWTGRIYQVYHHQTLRNL